MHKAHQSFCLCFSFMVAENGQSAKNGLKSISFKPAFKSGTKEDLNLSVDIKFWNPPWLPEELSKALQKNPEEVLSVTILEDRAGHWTHVTDNRHLVNAVDLQSGSTYDFWPGYFFEYNIHVNSVSVGSTYLIIIDITKHQPINPRSMVKFRLVYFLLQHLKSPYQMHLHTFVSRHYKSGHT